MSGQENGSYSDPIKGNGYCIFQQFKMNLSSGNMEMTTQAETRFEEILTKCGYEMMDFVRDMEQITHDQRLLVDFVRDHQLEYISKEGMLEIEKANAAFLEMWKKFRRVIKHVNCQMAWEAVAMEMEQN